MSYLKQAPLIGCLLITSNAKASDIVLYREGLVTEISTRMARLDGLSEELEFQQFDSLLEQHKATLSRGLMSGCLLKPAELEAEDLTKRLTRGQAAVQYEDFEPANQHLTVAEQLFRCSTDVVDPAIGAQLYMLFAIVAYHQGDERSSRDRFERAFLFQGDLEWDTGNPLDSKPIFEEARWSIYERAPARLYVEPNYGTDIYINGRVPERTDEFYLIPQGEHLLQLRDGDYTYSISLESGEVILSPPIVADPSIFGSPKEQKDSKRLRKVLAHLFPQHTKLYLVDDEEVWEHVVGSTDFENRWDDVLVNDGNRKKRTITAWTLVGSGAAIAAGSTAMMLTGLSRANEADTAMSEANNLARTSTDPSEIMTHNENYDSALQDYTKAYALNLIGAVSAVGGGMLAGGGVTLLATSSSQIKTDSGLIQIRLNLPQRGLK